MKEKDLEKHLDNLIIEGLIKEAEQDNADFEAAMRRMSNSDFEELIYGSKEEGRDAASIAASIVPEPVYETSEHFSHASVCEDACMNSFILPSAEAPEPKVECDAPQAIAAHVSRWDVFRPWITSAFAAAAVILVVLIPSINHMNGKLCDSALYASQPYMTPSKGGLDITSATVDEIKELLPTLVNRYEACLIEIERSRAHFSPDLREAGWDLTLAYLKLHKKGDAEKVLKVLSAQYNGTPFGNHCQKMLDQL